MALLLCDSIGTLISGCCTVVCHVITFPCRICCEGTRFGCEAIGRACTSPFFPYLAVTCVLNVPPTVWGIRSLIPQNCGVDWLPINGLATLLHILGAWYIVSRIQHENLEEEYKMAIPDLEGQKQTSFQRVKDSTRSVTHSVSNGLCVRSSSIEGRANSIPRLWQVLCYDIGVAIYIVILLAWMVWIGIGSSRIFGNVAVDEWDVGNACSHTGKWVRYSVIFGWVYLWLVCCSFCCSLLCIRPV